ncbi:MAG TPA: hypothetical protein VKU02_07300 [Gemmataceae bacterium]|nr:hypothetical protein [Gemmataceae bacterium]
MLPIFCLRLASGLTAALLLLPAALVNPRFFRTQFLMVFGLGLATAIFLRGTGDLWLSLALGGMILLAFLVSLAWSLEGAPATHVLGVVTAIASAATLCLTSLQSANEASPGRVVLGELSSAAVLGTATTAMLMGHSYLIAPSMSLTPLLRLVLAFFITLGIRSLVSGIGLWLWLREHSLAASDELVLFLPLRWGIGFVGPAVLGIMAWKTAKIRSTQSATGILYVVVILIFLGELVGQVLLHNDLLY